ncbi:MAG: hypothetical protein F2763_07655 [Actinobacteria bacterium]|uniref:Unannotated protein n=1 Tax=freshwater metagenome TaxID=449393 RepID=A0A6J7ANQ2_9ZZZZ|nr:hypothetical protein [Actinomycetota bacterium]
MRKTVIAAAAAALVLVGLVFYLTRAGGSSDVALVANAEASASAVATVAPSPSPGVELAKWAGRVCVARDGVGATLVDLGKDLTYDPKSGISVADQFQVQLDAHLGEINAAMEKLGTALGGVPIDYVDASKIVTQVQASGETLMKARDETAVHIDAARNSQDPLSLAAALVQAGISAKSTFDAGKEFIKVLDEATSSTRGDLGKAFEAAPQC